MYLGASLLQEEDAAVVAPAAEAHLAAAAQLLGVDAEGLRKALTTRTRFTHDGAIVSPLDVKASTQNRDSLAKVCGDGLALPMSWEVVPHRFPNLSPSSSLRLP